MSGNNKGGKFVKWFSELSNKDINVAGGKGASLAEMYNNKFPIPPGFVVTAEAYRYFIEKAGLGEKIKEMLSLDVEDTGALNEASKKIREMIDNSEMPEELEKDILEAYDMLDVDKGDIDKAGSGAMEILRTSHEPPFVAVRSSATAEDLADASFAGQQDTFLNVKGTKDLLKNIKKCFSSLFTARAIYYREKKGFKHENVYLAVIVQVMIDSEKSGVIFSTNPVKKEDHVLIEAVFGLGEGIVSGRIKPDHYLVDSDLENFKILDMEINKKKIAIVRDSSGENKSVSLTEEKSKQQVLSNYEIKRLAQYAKKLEEHYKKPQDIEFAIADKEIYIVQSRPITTTFKEPEREISGEILLSGLGASPGIKSGAVRIIRDLSDLGKLKSGDVLVTEMTNPAMVVSMQKSAAIVTDEGGVTSHAAIVSREMGIPCIVGTGNATEKLKEEQVVTVDGYSGKVYEGRGETKVAEIKPVVETKTKIKVIVDLPDFSERAAQSGAKGIGLVRIEGIIASSGKHPMKFVKEKRIRDYIEMLSRGLKKIVEPFDEAWIRTSDIRSDEYRRLEGAQKEVEGNPMLGNHGIRFGLKNPDILRAELSAVKEIADDFPKKKLGVMMPLVISVEELKETKRIAHEEIGMPSNVKLGIMVETPAAVQIINDLLEEGVDFISFGTNDLTQYTLAVDRNNADVQDIYNEMNPAVLNSISYVLRRCKKYNVETSICGQAGSKEEVVKFLLEHGIGSISVNADAAHKISKLVAELEEGGIVQEDFVQGMEMKEDKEEKQEEKHEMADIGEDEKRDIEDVILQQLGNDGDEYEPGEAYKESKDIPPLNEAIPVESSDFEEFDSQEEEREIDLNEDSEWQGEDRHEGDIDEKEEVYEDKEDSRLDIF